MSIRALAAPGPPWNDSKDPRLVIPLAALLFGIVIWPPVTAFPFLRQRPENVEYRAQGNGAVVSAEGAERGHHGGNYTHESPHARLRGGLEALVEKLWRAAMKRREPVAGRRSPERRCASSTRSRLGRHPCRPCPTATLQARIGHLASMLHHSLSWKLLWATDFLVTLGWYWSPVESTRDESDHHVSVGDVCLIGQSLASRRDVDQWTHIPRWMKF